MTRPILLRLLPRLFLFLVAVGIHDDVASQKTSARKPNVVIILADDMGYGDVSYNNPRARTKTPHIDQLAKEGLRFTDAHSGGAVCIPSRYGLITGSYFFRANKQPGYMGYLPPLIDDGQETVGSLMQRAGYSTACVGKWHLGLNWSRKDADKPLVKSGTPVTYTNTNFSGPVRNGPTALGFDYSFILPASLDMAPYVFVKNDRVEDDSIILSTDVYPQSKADTRYVFDRKYTTGNDIYWERGVWWRNGEMSKSFRLEDCLDTVVSEGLSFMTRHVNSDPKKPFLLYLALTAPHTPWLPGDQFRNASGMGTYGDFISRTDQVVNQVREALRLLGIDDNTLLIFTSDNGAHWSEEDVQTYAHESNWNRRGQKGDAWDGGHHVPMFVSWPARIKKSRAYTETVSLVDVIATLAELTGEKIAEKNAVDSRSFYKVLLTDHKKPTRNNIVYISSSGKLAIKKGNWKYIDGLGSAGFSAPSSPEPMAGGPSGQLYNLAEDPFETTNLFLLNPSKTRELRDLLYSLTTSN